MHLGRDGFTKNRCWSRDINGKRPPASSGSRYKQTTENAFQLPQNGIKRYNVDDTSSDHKHVCLTSKSTNSLKQDRLLSWINDSGCTTRITLGWKIFSTFQSVSNFTVQVGKKEKAMAVGREYILLETQFGERISKLKLQNVLHVPSFQ